MLTIQVHDEQVAQQLQEIAARENRPVEDVLKTMLAQYPAQYPAVPHNEPEPSSPDISTKRIRQKAYAKARAYWHAVGDKAKATMSDAALDEHFAAFDADGIPRLKSELDLSSPPVGSLAYAAKVMREMGRSG